MMEYVYQENSLIESVEFIESFEVFCYGKKINIDFNSLKENVKNLFSLARILPALSVSLHKETISELKKDFWLKINFNKEIKINDLPFTSLLIKLEKTGGFNMIRFYNNKFEGRCIYLALDEEVDLLELIK